MDKILGPLTGMALTMLLLGFIVALDMPLVYYIPAILSGFSIGATVSKICMNKK